MPVGLVHVKYEVVAVPGAIQDVILLRDKGSHADAPIYRAAIKRGKTDADFFDNFTSGKVAMGFEKGTGKLKRIYDMRTPGKIKMVYQVSA